MDSLNRTTTVEDQQLAEWRMHYGPHFGDISTLYFLHFPNLFLPFLLAGIVFLSPFSKFQLHCVCCTSFVLTFSMLRSGLGSKITVYNLELSKRIIFFSVFEGVRVHRIASSFPQGNVIAVFGEMRVKLFSIVFDSISQSPELTLIHLLPKFGHSVLDVCFLKVSESEYLTDFNFEIMSVSSYCVLTWVAFLFSFYLVVGILTSFQCGE